MTLPSFLKGESIARLLQGGAVGAIATIMLGFNWGGWTLGATATKQADDQTKTALVSALAPICVDNFQSSEDMDTNLVALNEVSSYQRAGFIEDGGWAVLPGSEKASAGVAKEYAKLLTATYLIVGGDTQTSLAERGLI